LLWLLTIVPINSLDADEENEPEDPVEDETPDCPHMLNSDGMCIPPVHSRPQSRAKPIDVPSQTNVTDEPTHGCTFTSKRYTYPVFVVNNDTSHWCSSNDTFQAAMRYDMGEGNCLYTTKIRAHFAIYDFDDLLGFQINFREVGDETGPGDVFESQFINLLNYKLLDRIGEEGEDYEDWYLVQFELKESNPVSACGLGWLEIYGVLKEGANYCNTAWIFDYYDFEDQGVAFQYGNGDGLISERGEGAVVSSFQIIGECDHAHNHPMVIGAVVTFFVAFIVIIFVIVFI